MTKPLPQIDALVIEKIVNGGQALGYHQGKPIFVWNALPGETVRVQITRKNSKIIEGYAIEVTTPSPLRIEPQEKHWMSCSPWQIIDSATECEYTLAQARSIFSHVDISTDSLGYVEGVDDLHYRNKIEWSFAPNELGEPSLAFFGRGTHTRISVEGCVLATDTINSISNEILAWIRAQHIPLRSLKSMIVRSNREGEAIVGLFLKDHLQFEYYPKLSEHLKGFHVYYSSHKSPASVVHGVLYTAGDESIEQRVLNTPLRHGLNGFFQVNIPVFEQVVRDIDARIPHDRMLLDFYGGVGSIGIPLSALHAVPLRIIESNEESTRYAELNIAAAQVDGKVFTGTAEQLIEQIVHDSVLIVDPPRAGLHEKVVERIGVVLPEVIAYVSCNIATQARDLQLLSRWYQVEFLSLYNFFPHTPHIEALALLKKR